jgi:hypothetical protein
MPTEQESYRTPVHRQSIDFVEEFCVGPCDITNNLAPHLSSRQESKFDKTNYMCNHKYNYTCKHEPKAKTKTKTNPQD